MAGNEKTIQIVYDPKIEDSSSLSKFLGIVLEKAKFPIKLINFITIDDYLKRLESGRIDHFTICLNKSYSSVSLKISEIVEEPTYKFFSRYYHNKDRSIILLGLIMDISEIFSNENTKKNAWGKLVTFQKDYSETKLDGIYLVPPAEDHEDDDDVPEVIKSSEDVRKEEAPKVVKPKLEIKDSIVTQQDSPKGYSELLAYYKASKKFFDALQEMKDLSKKVEDIL